MQTPKEKAKQLLDIMSSQTYQYQPYAVAHYNVEEIGWEAGKKCALIAVDELIKLYDFSFPSRGFKISYWDEVKQEIEGL